LKLPRKGVSLETFSRKGMLQGKRECFKGKEYRCLERQEPWILVLKHFLETCSWETFSHILLKDKSPRECFKGKEYRCLERQEPWILVSSREILSLKTRIFKGYL